MGRGKELVKNTAIVAFGRICTKFLSFFLLPFYTAVLSQSDYGITDLLNTYVALLMPVIAFQIEDALFRFIIDIRENDQEKRKIVSTVICFCAFQSICFMAVFYIVQLFVEIPYQWYLLWNTIISIFSGALLQMTRGLGNNAVYAFGSFLNALTAIVLNIVLILWLDMRANGLFIAAFAANVVCVLYIILKQRVYRMVRLKWFDRSCLKQMLAYSLPLVPNSLSWWVVGASDKSIVSMVLGVSQNGILSVSQKFSTLYTNLYGIFNLTWTESASLHRDDRDSEAYYSQVIGMSFRLLVCMCIGVIAVVALAFPYLINENFDRAYYQIPIYMLSSLLHSVVGIYSVVYIAFKKTGKIAKTSVAAAVTNLVTNLILIRIIGLYAASISSVAAYAVMFAIRYFDIRKFVNIKIGKGVVVSSVLMLAVDIVVYYIRDIRLSVVNLLAAAGYAVWMNRNILKSVVQIVRNKLIK